MRLAFRKRVWSSDLLFGGTMARVVFWNKTIIPVGFLAHRSLKNGDLFGVGADTRLVPAAGG